MNHSPLLGLGFTVNLPEWFERISTEEYPLCFWYESSLVRPREYRGRFRDDLFHFTAFIAKSSSNFCLLYKEMYQSVGRMFALNIRAILITVQNVPTTLLLELRGPAVFYIRGMPRYMLEYPSMEHYLTR